MKPSYKHSDLTDKIIKAFYTVYNKLGYGFLEKVYENALLIELTKCGLKAVSQIPIKVYYDGLDVGMYFADFIVNDLVIIELKAAEGLIEEHEAQLVNYLKATDIEVGLLLNFGKTPQFKRKVFSAEYKTLV
jgi:GxxExxY protein